ncbi:MAG TPA: cysteine desulfurase family protein [Syntrophobacteraceae bacterium]|nr:cysteine desulfurase family protein [Syntrophobacteraceae bacterium]
MKHIYFDNNSTTRLHPDVLEEMLPYLRDTYGNASSIHWFGQEARRGMDRAREQVANLIGASSDEIVFTSGGTEADNQALIGIADAVGKPGSRIITTAVEHQAVMNSCRFLEKKGLSVTYLSVDSQGRIDLGTLADSIGDDVILISIMLANNEVGTVQPVREAAELAKSKGILFHTDAVQAVGRIPVDVRELGVDLLSLSGHKFHGPKGCGALFVRSGIPGPVLIHGGHHERRRRAGTENVAAIAGLGRACSIAAARLEDSSFFVGSLRDRLEKGITERVSGIKVNTCREHRLPNTLNVSFEGVDGQLLAMNLDLVGIAVSTGSACQSDTREPSYVLLAMGCSVGQATGCLRFSLSADNTGEEIDRVIDVLPDLVEGLRR